MTGSNLKFTQARNNQCVVVYIISYYNLKIMSVDTICMKWKNLKKRESGYI